MIPSDAASLEETIGYEFGDRDILIEALTHKSFHYENPSEAPRHNERLEFLGDAVISLVVVEYLYGLEARFTEAEMSKTKSFVVKGEVLYLIAKDIALGECLRLGRGEEDSGGRQKVSILSNALEALIGAVYVDGGLRAARRTVMSLLGGSIDDVLATGKRHDYKTELQEECQMRFGCLPEYRVVAQEGREHEKTFGVEVYINGRPFGAGKGRSKKEAQTEAARDALAALRRGA